MRLALVDVDGVVADCMALMVRDINHRYRSSSRMHDKLTVEDITEFSFFDFEHGILTKAEGKYAMENFARPGFAGEMLPIEGAIQGIKSFRENKYDIVFLTSPWTSSKDWCYLRTKWLKEFFNADPADIIYSHKKELIPADIFIDDKISTCENYATAHPNSNVLMYTQPWNSNYTIAHSNIQRFTWDKLGRDFDWKTLGDK